MNLITGVLMYGQLPNLHTGSKIEREVKDFDSFSQWDASSGKSSHLVSLRTWVWILKPTKKWQERTDFTNLSTHTHSDTCPLSTVNIHTE